MREVLSFLFDIFTDPLDLPIAWYWEWIILAIIAFAAYAIAFRAVGDLYDGGMISGSTAGSKGKGLVVANAFAARRLGLYPCGLIPYQPGKDRRNPRSGKGT